jgi:hypothetical protein
MSYKRFAASVYSIFRAKIVADYYVAAGCQLECQTLVLAGSMSSTSPIFLNRLSDTCPFLAGSVSAAKSVLTTKNSCVRPMSDASLTLSGENEVGFATPGADRSEWNIVAPPDVYHVQSRSQGTTMKTTRLFLAFLTLVLLALTGCPSDGSSHGSGATSSSGSSSSGGY